MLHRIRLAMQSKSFVKDRRHWWLKSKSTKRSSAARRGTCTRRSARRSITGTGGSDKTVVMGMLERGGQVQRQGDCRPSRRKLAAGNPQATCEAGSSSLHRRMARVLRSGKSDYVHQVVNHLEKYVDGHVHTNGIENFWSLLKRGSERHLRCRRTVPLVPLRGRASIPLQQSRNQRQSAERCGQIPSSLITDCGKAADFRGGDWQGGRNGVLALRGRNAGSGSPLLSRASALASRPQF